MSIQKNIIKQIKNNGIYEENELIEKKLKKAF